MFLALVGVAIVLGAISVSSAGDLAKDCKRGQDCALDAFKGGEIRPLAEVLAVVRDAVPGEIVKIELDREKGEWIYEVKVLTPKGRRREVDINAKTLVIKKID